MKRYHLLDKRQQSINGKPEGGWLRVPPAPALWVKRRETAQTFTADEIEALKKEWPYLEGCEVVPTDQENRNEIPASESK